METIQAITTAQIEEVLNRVVQDYLLPKFRSLGMPASGEWEANIHVRENVIRGRKYTEQLVYGRRPGKFAPIQPLIEWAQVKLGLSGREAVSAAWAINKKMQAEGTSWYRKGGSDLMEVLYSPEVVRFIKKEFGRHITVNTELWVSQLLREQF